MTEKVQSNIQFIFYLTSAINVLMYEPVLEQTITVLINTESKLSAWI